MKANRHWNKELKKWDKKSRQRKKEIHLNTE